MTDNCKSPEIHISLEAAAALEEKSYAAMKTSLRRRNVILRADPADQRRKLVPVSALSPRGYSNWLKGEHVSPTVPALTTIAPVVEHSSDKVQPFLPFHQTATESKLAAAIPPAIPAYQRPYVERWAAIVGQSINGTWKKYRGGTFEGIPVHTARDFTRALATLHGVGVSTIYAKTQLMRELKSDPAVPREAIWSEFWKRALPQLKPGRNGHSIFDDPDNGWMLFQLQSFYLTQAKLSVKRARELLCEEIDAKQRRWTVGHIYDKPTLRQCRIALAKVDLATLTLGRDGEKAYNDRCATFLSRRPPEHANDVWVTDQRLCNVRLRDGGNRLGRVWVVNFLDVASWRWLGCWFGPYLDSDMVMHAAAMSLERAGVPRAIHMDLGKEFVGSRFLGGIFKISGKALFSGASGLWERLGTKVVKAIGRNPQSKIIERWHREVDRFDQEMPGWCGSNTDERPETLAREEAAHQAWLATGLGVSPLLRIGDYINRYVVFCEQRWNAEHRGEGKYLQGMTPNEKWNISLPTERRTLTPEEIDIQTSDHRFVKVARGGQVNLTFHGQTIEYVSEALFPRQGEDVEVIVSRRSLGHVSVIFKVPGGTSSCVAHQKPLHDWLPENREELKLALRCRGALKRQVKRGLAASRVLSETRSIGELPAAAVRIAPELAASFGAPELRTEKESTPTRRGNFASDIAREALEMEAGI